MEERKVKSISGVWNIWTKLFIRCQNSLLRLIDTVNSYFFNETTEINENKNSSHTSHSSLIYKLTQCSRHDCFHLWWTGGRLRGKKGLKCNMTVSLEVRILWRRGTSCFWATVTESLLVTLSHLFLLSSAGRAVLWRGRLLVHLRHGE